MNMGFTGTRFGMNKRQLDELRSWFSNVTFFHHGMCIGADKQAHEIARQFGISIVGHPPIDNSKMSDVECDFIRKPFDYRIRNRNIVMETDFLLVAPISNVEEIRSGTWATKRYAESIGKKFHILERE